VSYLEWADDAIGWAEEDLGEVNWWRDEIDRSCFSSEV
jgi:hypothetical protein